MAYDERCYELAAVFLETEPVLYTEKHNVALAQLIQSTIEAYIRHERDNFEPADDPVAWAGGFAENH